MMMDEVLFNSFLETALREDIGDGDHSSLSCIPSSSKGTARLLIKDEGIIAGIDIAILIFRRIDPGLKLDLFLKDGVRVKNGDIAFTVSGKVLSILKSERLVLNVMQRMSGIATQTSQYVQKLEGLKTRILDTRKTTPGMRILDKEAVRIGGGMNHRMGLYDMIMLKDNHIDFAGGIEKAINKTSLYLKNEGKDLQIEIEARSQEDVREILRVGKIHRIMLDNFSPAQTRQAIELIAGRFETESSGNITLENLRDYAECGVDFISVGALTHQIRSLDFSLKAIQ
ncbi:MAG: carboxylating nicotinate-nucleotide diphosphorylase [Bacteroidales bacterium]|nr:carboxylating nicotinate-nucleotide diphosphorylase [Bacteroidales bacterium]